MRTWIMVFFAVAAVGIVPAGAQDLTWEILRHEEVDRDFGWYVGSGAGVGLSPVVLLLHGGGGNASQVWTGDDGQAWRRIADDHGLILLLPEGRSDPGTVDAHHWNDCRSNIVEPSASSRADDAGFLRAVVGWAADRWPVDLDRVYVTGASNGGMMSFRLAMEASNLIAAAAPIIANMPEPSECRGPSRAIPMLIMNGTEDPLMPWNGGCVAGARCERGTVRSTDATVEFWMNVNHTDPQPSCVDLPDIVASDRSTVHVCRWSDGIADAEVVLYRIEGGGHTVPGPDPLPLWYRLIVGPKNRDISAADEIWSFFERHSRRSPAPRPITGRVGG